MSKILRYSAIAVILLASVIQWLVPSNSWTTLVLRLSLYGVGAWLVIRNIRTGQYRVR